MNAEKAILVGYDGSRHSKHALRWALEEARRRHVPVTVLHADTPDIVWTGLGAGFYDPDSDPRMAAGKVLLAEAATKAEDWAPDVAVSTTLKATTPALALLEAADEASMVVLGSRGLTGFTELLVGATSVQVATHATVPVVVLRPRGDQHADGAQAGRVVVGVDGSDAAQDALRFAFEEAQLRGVGLTAVRAWRSEYFDSSGAKGGAIPAHVEDETFVPAETAALHEAVAAWSSKHPDVDVRELVVHATTVGALVDASRGAELLVVGSRGRGGFRSLMLGSVSHAALHHAHAPVAVVHALTTP